MMDSKRLEGSKKDYRDVYWQLAKEFDHLNGFLGVVCGGLGDAEALKPAVSE